MRIGDNSQRGMHSHNLSAPAQRNVCDSSSSGLQDSYSRESGEIRITILATNDIHGHLQPFVDKNRGKSPGSSGGEIGSEQAGGMAQISQKIRQERSKNPEGTIVLDAGDISTGFPLSDILKGEPMVKTMSAMGYDAVAVGNHDFDKGRDNLGYLISEAGFPFLSANLINRNSAHPLPAKPYIIKDVNGVKVGIMGLTTPGALKHLSTQDQGEIGFDSTLETAKALIPDMKRNGAQLIVALTHQGIDEDRAMAEAVDGIDVIVGGHSHTEMPQAEKVRNTYIVQSGCFGKKLEQLDLDLYMKDGAVSIARADSRLIRIDRDCPADPGVEAIIKGYSDQLQGFLGREVGSAGVQLTSQDYHSSQKESNLADFVTDTVRDSTGSDFCLFPPSSFRGTIDRGKVKVEDIYRIYPGDDGLSVTTMTGENLLKAIESGLDDKALRVAPSGLRLTYDLRRPKGQRIVSIATMKGKQILPQATYTVAVRNFMLDNPGKFDEYKNYTERQAVYRSCQDMLIERFQQGKSINQAIDGRIENVTAPD